MRKQARELDPLGSVVAREMLGRGRSSSCRMRELSLCGQRVNGLWSDGGYLHQPRDASRDRGELLFTRRVTMVVSPSKGGHACE